jgi:hypothetical protein
MADTTNLLAGTATLTVNGTAYKLVGDFSYSVSKVTRETMKGMDTVHGYKETPHAPFIAAKLRNTSGLSVADLNAMTNVTVVVELGNGKTVIGRNMWTVEDQEVDGSEGTIPVRWEGMNVEEA